jgi:hypothetical protein
MGNNGIARTNSIYTRDGNRIQRFDDIPGNATNIPIAIDIAAAINDSRIVAPNPFNRKRMLLYPDVVVGSITYHPHVPDAELHPARTVMAKMTIAVLNFMIPPSML